MILDAQGNATQKVAICTPCTDTVSAGYALDLVQLVARTLLTLPGLDLMVLQVKGTLLPHQRHQLVTRAKDANCSHVLWIDADMRFPADALLNLLSHEQPIVACNYSTRRLPIEPTAERTVDGHLYTDETADGLIAVDLCGMGLMLVAMSVYETIPAPWFAVGWNGSAETYASEDVFFCSTAAKHGFPILIDQGLSRQVKHSGGFEYTNQHAVMAREAMPI